MSKYLEVIWAKTHNLKNINVKIPKNKITVITGVSWSGKSSLAFNTIYNVWKQKYMESLSSYARMFIWWMKEEADVSEINWLSPTISIDQKTTSKNPRSTVWTITEIYDYYKLLYLNVWERRCVNCDNIVKKDSMLDIINYLSTLDKWTKFMLTAQIKWDFNSFEEVKKEVLDLWFIRFSIWDKLYTVNDKIELNNIWEVFVIVDRLVVKDFLDKESADTKRLKDSLELSYKIWEGQLYIQIIWGKKISFSNVFICSNCWHIPAELNISSFSFNSHVWACQECHWLWVKKVFLEEKIINNNLTLLEWAVIAPWFWGDYFFALIEVVWKKNKIDLNSNYSLLSQREKNIILNWTWDVMYKISYTNEYWINNTYNSRFEWVINTLTRRYYDWWSEKGVYEDYVIDMDCHVCDWNRLNRESLSVYLSWLNIWELSNLPVNKALKFIKTIKLSVSQEKISKKVLKNMLERLEFLSGVWLTYMTISRKAWTLSGWEAQRIRLATQIWTKLEWIIYVLDEPSIWLHPRDNDMLIGNLKKLRDIWNTLIIVEHDEDIMRKSDHIIDIWPWAWIHGWQIIFEWTIDEIVKDEKSITWPYLNGTRNVIIKRWNRPSYKDLNKNWKVLNIIWAHENNLKNINVTIPLSNLVVVTGVSWSGKSSLVNDILANYLANNLNRAKRTVWAVKSITWLENLDKVVIIDQSPIWKTPRSNPATYTWVFTPIREVFSMSEESQIRWFGPGRFSFNTKQWRCSECDWDGVKKIEMHFLPPVYIECESCNWKRYNSETLQIKYKGKTISDVLKMTVEEWLDFFSNHPKIQKTLKVLNKVWLWYIELWQSSVTLSGWEAQRIKLSTELSKRSTGKTFYILDEPTTWLHFQDVDRLLTILHSLVEKWNSVIVIEHNMDVIINADHIIDIWLEWWDKWGELIWYWTIEDIMNCKKSYTGDAIKRYINK
jgi:excinuclease ABC subunit A